MRALGPVDVLLNGETAPPPLLWKRPLALLLYLARSPRHARTREHLVGLLWPEDPAPAAHHSLNEALRILRRHGGTALVETPADQVRLNLATLDLDIERFEQLAEEGRWAEASDLVGGEFLEGFGIPGASGVEDWLRMERDAWRHRCVESLVRRADQLMESGDAEEGSRHLQRALTLDPYSEAGMRGLMRSLGLRGLRLEALQAYDAFASRLAADLGTHPDAETAALADRVRRGKVWRQTATPDASTHSSRRAPLVGRSRQLAMLLKAWSACRAGPTAGGALILGDPGMGKSRLAEELVERARLDGAAVVTTRAVEADLAEPWSGILAVAEGGLLDVSGIAGAPPAALGAFAVRLASWAERFPAAQSQGGPALGRAFRQVVRAACGEQPLVLLLDDAQWLDQSSWLSLAAIFRELAKLPCFVVITASGRPSRPELDELRSRLAREERGVTVSLRALTREDIQVLALWALPRYDLREVDRVTRRVATDSAGLPLLAVELFNAVALGLELGQIATAWPEPFRTLDQTLPGGFPDAVVGAIRVNYRGLSRDAQAALVAIAVIGGRVPISVLRRATNLAPGALEVALDELEWERWVTAEPRGYGFVARVVGDVIAQDMVIPGVGQRILERAQDESSNAGASRRT